MSWANKEEKCIGMVVRGKLGRPMDCGWAMCGWSQCGESIDWCGTYQMRRVRKNIHKFGNGKFGKPTICKMMPTWPVQPPSVLRDAQQAKFVTALGMWQSLTSEEKSAYNVIADKKRRRGYDYFMSKTLKSL